MAVAATSSPLTYTAPTLLPSPPVPRPQLIPVEERLKFIVQNRRLRLTEFFQDYDPLRSGYITNSQFRRCLDQNLSLPLTDEEYSELMSKYDPLLTGRINYGQFIQSLQKSFIPEQLDGHPSDQFEPDTTTSTSGTTTLSPSHKERTDQLLVKCAQYYKNRGIFVKNCYEDFDRHNMGFITLSQFHRSFPGPDYITETEIYLLAQRYYDSYIKLYNYYKFDEEVRTVWNKDGKCVTFRHQPPQNNETLPDSVDDIISQIRDTVYKYGIRTTEFFRDYDKLRTGLITVAQFKCGLSLCLSKRLVLSREEIDKLVNHFIASSSDGEHVKYKEFCDIMENAYNLSNFEKKPTSTVYRPLKGHLHKPINTLSSEDEMKLNTLLCRLKEQVSKRRILLHPYFRDFDRKKGYTRGVTRSQFERLFQFLSLPISPEEINLIQSKFGDPYNGDINYCALVQYIDAQYIGQIVEEEKNTNDNNEHEKQLSKLSLNTSTDIPPVHEVLAYIQCHVLTKRIRVTEYFQDFDPLRSGHISISRFRQALSSIGFPNLTTVQFQSLVQYYTVIKGEGNNVIAWKNFVHDVDQVFQSDTIPSISTSTVLTNKGERVTPEENEGTVLLENVLRRLREQVEKRRIMVKPIFQDFDRHNSGHVTVSNYRQCLSYLDLPISEEESTVLQSLCNDSTGFNYMILLKEIQPQLSPTDNYTSRMATIRSDRERLEQLHNTFDESVNVQHVLYRIRTKVVRERIRVLEFLRDYDKLKSGRILSTVFHRALDLCGFQLTPSEIHVLINEYCYSKDPSYVNYVQFSDDVETVFTVKELEKMPTLEVEQFKPPEEVDLNITVPNEDIIQDILYRLANIVRTKRISLYPPFADYDKVHRGNVSKGQFIRVLNDLSLTSLLSQHELDLLVNKFSLQLGGRIDVNYNSFCLVIDEYANTIITTTTTAQ